jgi:deoxyribodipyrimidine photolyase-related protein
VDSVSVVFPHQLFENNPALSAARNVVLVECDLIFNQYNFHVTKRIFHRLSMMRYAEELLKKGFKVRYIDADSPLSNATNLVAELAKTYKEIHAVEPEDDWLSKHIKNGLKGQNIKWVYHENPNFLTPNSVSYDFFKDKKRYHQTDFYAFQRKRLNILLDKNQKPVGGKLTFDAENRKPFPKNHRFPAIKFPKIEADFIRAKNYILEKFPLSLGSVRYFEDHGHFYPTNTEEAKQFFLSFLEERFLFFGDYEDAFGQSSQEYFLYHSLLTPALNVGLINPEYIVNTTLDFAQNHHVPINSVEGFIRQIIGWREFMRIVYHDVGRKQRTSNFWNFQRKIPPCFYDGTTGILPVDQVIKKTLETAYAHHIERLMVLGNFFLLCEFHPDEVYRWFMELFIDAYDWVMVPNVYGMSQFADGGMITTKPYLSGSNYILKMSDYPKKREFWHDTWDGLFWRFINEHRQFFQQNPRLGMMVLTYDKMQEATKVKHYQFAENFLQSLDQ